MSPTQAKKKPKLGPGRLSAEDAAELPDRLMDAAVLQFAEHGYGDTSMDHIARRAGASTKTLYSRFANKSELLEAVIRRNIQRAVADHLRAFALDPAGAQPREFLYKFGLQVAIATDPETEGLTRITFSEAHRFPVLRRMYKEVTGRAIEAIGAAMMIWRESGSLKFEGDAEQLAAVCFGMMCDGPRIRSILGDPLSRSETERHVALAVDLFLRGLPVKNARA